MLQLPCKYKPRTTLWLLPMLTLCLSCGRSNFYTDTQVMDLLVYRQLLEEPAAVDSVTVQAGGHYERGKLYEWVLGARHRTAWAAPVTVPVLRLDTVKGGLSVEKIGGGMQTISATLVGGDGMTYALRTVDKRPDVNLPAPLRSTFLKDLVLDQTSALHPYAALVVAPLSKAVGVPHTNPQLVYVKPHEQALKEHRDLLSDRLYLLEEKYNDERALRGELAEAEAIMNTDDMLENRYKHSNHTIDQAAYARARLLDLLIGDRDRHEDQWEWAAYRERGGYVYRPIPKDRDNAFFRFDDGVLSWLLSRKWAQRKFVTFHANYRDVKALMLKSEELDQQALSGMSARQIDSVAQAMQFALTDEVIAKAVAQLPPAVFREYGPNLTRQLQRRRDTLGEAAKEFYSILAKEVAVRGTHQNDRFELERISDDETTVTLYSGESNHVVFRRVFNRADTDKIMLYGLGGDDTFTVRGQGKASIKVSIKGGAGHDTVAGVGPTNSWRKKVSVSSVEDRQ